MPRGTPARVLIVDDHPLINHGLAELIADEAGLTVCGRAHTTQEARDLFTSTRPDLVILDLLLSNGDDGFDLLAEFRDADGDARVLVFSSLEPAVHADRARRLGATAYIHKSRAVAEVLPAIRSALEEPPS